MVPGTIVFPLGHIMHGMMIAMFAAGVPVAMSNGPSHIVAADGVMAADGMVMKAMQSGACDRIGGKHYRACGFSNYPVSVHGRKTKASIIEPSAGGPSAQSLFSINFPAVSTMFFVTLQPLGFI